LNVDVGYEKPTPARLGYPARESTLAAARDILASFVAIALLKKSSQVVPIIFSRFQLLFKVSINAFKRFATVRCKVSK
jgi:hypothetical protein